MSAGNGDGGAQGFAFTPENRAAADKYIAKYPEGRQASAVLPLLDIAQRQNGGWLSRAAIEHVADVLEMPYIRVQEVVSFYSMFYLQPVGRHVVQVCTTTPCWLCGSADIVAACSERLGIGLGQTTADGAFTLIEVECLGACVNAPMMQIGDHYYEDLDKDSTKKILDAIARGETPKTGTQVGRQTSAPLGGPTTLTERPARGGA